MALAPMNTISITQITMMQQAQSGMRHNRCAWRISKTILIYSLTPQDETRHPRRNPKRVGTLLRGKVMYQVMYQ
jgi:hypothetical protein